MVEIKIRPFSFLDKGKILIILLSTCIQHPFGVFTYFRIKTPHLLLFLAFKSLISAYLQSRL